MFGLLLPQIVCMHGAWKLLYSMKLYAISQNRGFTLLASKAAYQQRVDDTSYILLTFTLKEILKQAMFMFFKGTPL